LAISPSLSAEQAGFRTEARLIDNDLHPPIFIGQ